jgi:hypothetical protein
MGSVVAAMLAGAALGPAAARADGDPASDTLIAQDVFYPYSISVPDVARRSLDRAVAAAKRVGAPVKVALIARRDDLGSITGLWGEPQRYARFLHTEISYGHPVRLLVVMPSGAGTVGFPAKLARALQGAASVDDGGSGTASTGGSGGASTGGESGPALGSALAYAATRAVDRLAAAARRGGDVGSPQAASGHGRTVLLLVLILAAVLVSGAIVVLRVFFPAPPADRAGSGGKA